MKIRNKLPRIKWLLDVNDPAVVKAINPRVNWKEIDPTKGSATGYIGAKYIAKNINGHKVGMDYEAEAPVDHTTIAVAAWAKLLAHSPASADRRAVCLGLARAAPPGRRGDRVGLCAGGGPLCR